MASTHAVNEPGMAHRARNSRKRPPPNSRVEDYLHFGAHHQSAHASSTKAVPLDGSQERDQYGHTEADRNSIDRAVNNVNSRLDAEDDDAYETKRQKMSSKSTKMKKVDEIEKLVGEGNVPNLIPEYLAPFLRGHGKDRAIDSPHRWSDKLLSALLRLCNKVQDVDLIRPTIEKIATERMRATSNSESYVLPEDVDKVLKELDSHQVERRNRSPTLEHYGISPQLGVAGASGKHRSATAAQQTIDDIPDDADQSPVTPVRSNQAQRSEFKHKQRAAANQNPEEQGSRNQNSKGKARAGPSDEKRTAGTRSSGTGESEMVRMSQAALDTLVDLSGEQSLLAKECEELRNQLTGLEENQLRELQERARHLRAEIERRKKRLELIEEERAWIRGETEPA